MQELTGQQCRKYDTAQCEQRRTAPGALALWKVPLEGPLCRRHEARFGRAAADAVAGVECLLFQQRTDGVAFHDDGLDARAPVGGIQ